MKKEPYSKRDTGSKITWKPDLEVFTDIDIQPEYFLDVMKRQAIVNAGVEFVFRNQTGRTFETTTFNYANGVVDHVAELIGENGTTTWGLSVRVILEGYPFLTPGSYGWSGAYGTHFFIDPENEITAIYMKNTRWFDSRGAGNTGRHFEADVTASLV